MTVRVQHLTQKIKQLWTQWLIAADYKKHKQEQSFNRQEEYLNNYGSNVNIGYVETGSHHCRYQ